MFSFLERISTNKLAADITNAVIETISGADCNQDG